MERKGFFCYNSWLKALEPFGDAERGRIWTALLEYSNGLAIDGHSSGNERFILPMLIDQLDRDTQKNEKKSQTLKERQSQLTPSNTAQPTATRSNPPKDKDKNKDKDKDKDKEILSFADAQESTPARKRFVPPTEQECAQFFLEHGGTAAGAERFMNHYGSNGWKVGKNNMVDWHKAAKGWILRDNEKKGGDFDWLTGQ